MLESAILGSIKTVYDMIMALISAHDTQKRNLFVDHVEPLHARMEAIHKDYMAGFSELQCHLEAKSTPPGGLLAFLETRRRDFEIERDLAQQLTQHLASAERRPVRPDAWSALKTYCEAIADYFYPASNIAHTTWYTRFLDKVRGHVERGHTDVWWDPSIAGDPQGDHAREQLLYMTIIALRELPEAFKPINASYANLKTKLL